MNKKTHNKHTFSQMNTVVAAVVLILTLLSSTVVWPAFAAELQQNPVQTEPDQPFAPGVDIQVYLPLSFAGEEDTPLMLGVYPSGWINQDTVDTELVPLDQWTGKHHSLIGTFLPIDTPNYQAYVTDVLDTSWENGYTPFVNLSARNTAYAIASGALDNSLRSWARAFRDYARDGERSAFIAPLQEMNSCQRSGCWTVYGGDPANFKLAFRHIQNIFSEEGVPANSVHWTFAPNGWSDPVYDYPFESYYPGDALTEVVGFSAYNFGNCNGTSWQSPLVVFNNPNRAAPEGQYLDRMRAMAPDKPIIIAQTASSARYTSCSGVSDTAKNAWLEEAYNYLADYPGVWGVLYFNIPKSVDWPVFNGSVRYNGYVAGADNPGIIYLSPSDLHKNGLP